MRGSAGYRVHPRYRRVVGRHAGMAGLRSVRYFDQIEIQNQVGSGGNRWLADAMGGDIPITESQLPGNKDATLAAGLHAHRSHIPTGKRTSLSHD